MIRYKINVLEELKKRGYSTYYLKQNKIISDGTVQRLRDSKIVGTNVLELLCKLLKCDVGDIVEYTDDTAEK